MSGRVLHVDTGRTWRGGQAQVDLLVAGLAARGWEQAVAAPDGPLTARLKTRGIPTVPFMPFSDLDAVSALGLAARARAFAPDVLHLHDARAHATGWLAARATGAACVVSRRVAFGKRPGPLHVAKYRGLPVDLYLALSRAVREELRGLGVPAERIEIVPDAVDVGAVAVAVVTARGDGRAAARRALACPDAETPLVGAIGALTAEKGQDVLIAAAGLAAARPNVLLHGSGPEHRGLEAKANEPGAPRIVAFVTGDDPFTTLAALDLLVVPSRAEGLGSIVLAAQAVGVPVVATAVGGIPDVVVDGRTGLLVPPDDPGALARAIDRALTEREDTLARAEAARAAVAAHDVPRIAERTEAAYARARGGRPR